MIELKRFILVPRDAMELLARRFTALEDAQEAATESCAADGQAVYVLELRAVASRADRPVKVTTL